MIGFHRDFRPTPAASSHEVRPHGGSAISQTLCPSAICGESEVILARDSQALIYNASVIALARACMTGMVWLFFIGIAGSLLVIIISFFEDLNELVGKE